MTITRVRLRQLLATIFKLIGLSLMPQLAPVSYVVNKKKEETIRLSHAELMRHVVTKARIRHPNMANNHLFRVTSDFRPHSSEIVKFFASFVQEFTIIPIHLRANQLDHKGPPRNNASATREKIFPNNVFEHLRRGIIR